MIIKSEHHQPHRLSQSTMQSRVPRRLNSDELLQGQQEIEIEHQGMLYRLRCTAQGKLLLTK